MVMCRVGRCFVLRLLGLIDKGSSRLAVEGSVRFKLNWLARCFGEPLSRSHVVGPEPHRVTLATSQSQVKQGCELSGEVHIAPHILRLRSAMTAQPLRPPIPPYLQVGAKAASTAQSSQLQATASSTPAASRSASQARPTRVRQNETRIDTTSEAATLSLIRRVLSPDASHGAEQRETPRPIEDLLPPLTSFNEVDVQLYAIIAIVLRDCVYAWYSKITPDHVFVEEVVQIIAHCSRALEQRLRRTDVDELILDEIPALLEQHVQKYQVARQLQPLSAYGSTLEVVYHELNPHPALSPPPDSAETDTDHEQLHDEALYRQLLAQGALAVLLPTEDLDNACLRTLVGDIIADLMLGQGVSDRACEGWFVHDAIKKVADIVKARLEPKATGEEIEVETRGRLEKFGLLSSRDESQKSHSSTTHQSSLASLFWRILQSVYLMSLAVRFTFVGMSQARYRTPRSKHHQSSSLSEETGKVAPLPSTPGSSSATNATAESMTRPIMEYRIFAFISTLLDLSTRMPWLAGLLSICQHFTITGPGHIGRTDAMLDK